MSEPNTCRQCGHAILAPGSGRKYCSRPCYEDARRNNNKRNAAIYAAQRYAPPRSLAKPEVFTVGQRVRVPRAEVRKVGGKLVDVGGVDIGTISAVGDVIVVSVHTGRKNVTREFTPEQLRGAAVPEVFHRFGYPTPAGGEQ